MLCYWSVCPPPPRLNHYGLPLLFALLVGCPLPFEFSGEGSGIAGRRKLGGSTITAPVTFAYAESSGATGTIADGGSHISNADTIVTLTTSTPDATIYYTTDGSVITDINVPAVTRVDAASATYEIERTDAARTRTIHAVAIGPHMRPGPITTAKVEVTPYRILAYAPNYPAGFTGTPRNGTIPTAAGPEEAGSPVTATDPRTPAAAQMLLTVSADTYEFDGWNTAADGSGRRYSAGAGFTMPAANVTLYAQWARVVRIRYLTPRSTSPDPTVYEAVGTGVRATPLMEEWRQPGSTYPLPVKDETRPKPDGTPVTFSETGCGTTASSACTLSGWNTGGWSAAAPLPGTTGPAVTYLQSHQTGQQTTTADTDWYARWQ